MIEKRKVIKVGRYSQRNLLRPNWKVIHKEGKRHVYDVIVDEILEAYKARGVEYVTNKKIDFIIMEKYRRTIKESTAAAYRIIYKRYIKDFCGVDLCRKRTTGKDY